MTITYMGWSSFQQRMNLPRPRERRADGIEAELAINRLAHRIIDPGDDPRDLEDLERDLGRHDVAGIPIGRGGEAVRRLDPRLAQHVFVDPVAEHHLTLEVAAQPVEGSPIAVDDGDLMAGVGKRQGAQGADPPATDDHQLHEWKTHSRHYRPSLRRAASTSGRPASRILAWVVATSYGTRWKRTADAPRSTSAKAAAGFPSRGCPTLPGLTNAEGGRGIHSPGCGTCSPSSVKMRGR